MVSVIVNVTEKGSLHRLQKGIKYVASPCIGERLYFLYPADNQNDTQKDRDWEVKIESKLARRIREKQLKTESFREVVDRALRDWLKTQSQAQS